MNASPIRRIASIESVDRPLLGPEVAVGFQQRESRFDLADGPEASGSRDCVASLDDGDRVNRPATGCLLLPLSVFPAVCQWYRFRFRMNLR